MAEDTETKQSVVVRTVNRLLKLMGVSFPKDTPIPKSTERPRIHDFTYKELRHITGFDKNYNSGAVDGGAMHDYISQIAQQSRSWSKEIKNLKIMAPEIDQARDTVVSTILSPTDLQTDRISIIVENTGLGEDLEAEISGVLQDFFNDEYRLGERCVQWIGDALFETGATPVMVLPEKNLDLLNTAVDIDSLKAGIDPNDNVVKDTRRPTNIMGSTEDLFASCESLLSYSNEDATTSFIEKVADEFVDFTFSQEGAPSLESTDRFKNTAKQLASKITDMLNNNKNHIIFSADPTLLNATSSKLNANIDKLSKKISNNFLFSSYSPTFLADLGRKPGKDELPIVMKLPYHAVVPVTVPNSPDAHIGYFVVVDEWGTPLNEDYYDTSATGGGRKMADAGIQAVMGKPISSALGSISESNRFETASTIFGIMLRHMLDTKLNDFELTGATVHYREAVSSAIFRQLIHRKRVGIVFIPEPLMMYLCYDYNENGTGKSCIQDINIIVALRNILFISGVMAATENSIDRKKIEVAVDEKNANIEQTLNMVRNAFVEKNMLRFDNNPHTIQRDLVQKSMTIYPKGVRGLQDALNVSIDRAQTNSIEPNDTLISRLTDMLIMSLIAPAASMNKTGEEEYSRSVATTNLFFNNKIRAYQSHSTLFINKFIRLYIFYSSTLRGKLREILELAESKRKTKRKIEYEEQDTDKSEEAIGDLQDEDSDDDTELDEEDEREHTIINPQVKKSFKTNTRSIEANIKTIIQNVSIKLPAPRIVVDKAHFEEIQGYIGTLDTILQAIYPDETSMELSGYDKPLKLLRAVIKEDMIREYVKTIGFQSNYTLPQLADIDSTHAEENILKLVNVLKGINDIKTHIGDRVLPEEDSGYGGGSSYGGGGYGDSGFGGGGDSYNDSGGGGSVGGSSMSGPNLDDAPDMGGGPDEGSSAPAQQTQQSPGTTDTGGGLT